MYTWNNFMMNPVITTVNFLQSYPVKDVAMPGISVCNINKISKMKAEAYAEELSRKSGKPAEEILEGIKLLARLDNYNLPPGKDISFDFQDFLDKYDADADGYYNTHDKLRMLQVPCTEMLEDCFLYEKQRKCDDLFADDLTMEGHCCIFNYLSQSAKNISAVLLGNNRKPMTAGTVEEGGLKFKLNYNISDYTVTSLATTGVKPRFYAKYFRTKVDNFSIVHVIFDPPSVTFNKQDVFFYWYDMIGLFGGLCSLVMGISFVSVVELLYFFTYVFCKKLLSKPLGREEDGDND
ncbi:uncharacterized protein LOC108904878 [Anoplophora glabripennis]|uniref:uncharacterized protein LOC108904878 n=1 Tax=Anoplophora glabripennis TaxID=217634 RepID=UPI000C755F64|nr:uncharacterized protein LOC108904878 [Anoplophora glabripennis]